MKKLNLTELISDIFPVIQLFLSQNCYRQLMNSSKIAFEDLKYETVEYTLKGPERWFTIHGFRSSEEMKVAFIQFISVKVRNKAKQITIKSYLDSKFGRYRQLQHFTQNINVFSNIHRAVISLPVYLGFFPYHELCNIHHLVLIRINSVQTISEGFRNVTNLEIRRWESLEEIQSFATPHKFERLLIVDCLKLRSIPPLEQFPNMESFSLDNSKTLFKTPLNLLFQFFSRKEMEELSLTIKDKNQMYFFLNNSCCFKNISYLQLTNGLTFVPKIPLLYGKSIELYNFSLLLWKGQSLPELEVLTLRACKQVEFPQLPKLKMLSIYYCHNMIEVPPALSNCRKFIHVK
jgi:hypothetical protein